MGGRITGSASSTAEALDIVESVAHALAAATEHRIIHRDIKPANIIRTREGVVKLMDFGLARPEFDSTLTTHGAVLGTPIYVSPEQARGERDLDIRTDIYSLGITLFHMVVGGKTSADIAEMLYISPKTVESYRYRMMHKLGTPDLPSLIRFAVKEGLLA